MSDVPVPATPRSTGQPHFRLLTLGATALVDVSAGNKTVLGPGVPLALLTYLHASPGHTASRVHLADVFWASNNPARSRQALRQNLTRLRQILGAGAFEDRGTEVILTEPIASDRDGFEKAVQIQALETACEQYTGPFFPDYSGPGSAEFEHWVDRERERLRTLFTRSAELLVRRYLDHARIRDAHGIALRVRRESPESEAARRLVLETLLALHDSFGARIEADAILEWLRHAGRSPEPATAHLLERTRKDATAITESPEPGLRPDLVGREKQFHRLVMTWQEARAGKPRLLHLEARAGFGKTRLLEEVTARIETPTSRVLHLRARHGEREIEGSLAAEVALALGGLPGAKAVTPSTAALLVELHPGLGAIFSAVPGIQNGGSLLHHQALALTELMLAVADEAPLALFIDDLHWADESSRHVLSAAFSRLDRARILVITTGRPDTGRPLDGCPESISLGPLSHADAEAFLQSMGSFPDQAIARRAAGSLHHASGGSPLLMLEALRLALDHGDLHRDAGEWQFQDLERAVKSLGKHGALDQRVASLPEPARGALLLLAVAELAVDAKELAGADEGVGLCQLLSELESRGYVSGANGRWSLSHDEIAEAVIRAATETKLQYAHGAVGRMLALGSVARSSRVHRVARHLLAGKAYAELRTYFTRWVVEARNRGDRTPVSQLARELLANESAPATIDSLVSALPLQMRLGPRARITMTLTTAALLITVGVLGARHYLAGPQSPPDVELLLAREEFSTKQIGLFRVPIWKDRWVPGDTIRPDHGTLVGRLPAGVKTYGGIAPSPDGKLFAFGQVMSDSGGIDLFLWSSAGGIQRITSAPGDDIHANWSPDGRYITFATARWTPRGNDDADLAVFKVTDGSIRQLTHGPAYDQKPLWSPDGSRIMFHRRGPPPSRDVVCWISVDGRQEHCSAREWSGSSAPISWIGPDRALLAGTDGPGHKIVWWMDADSTGPIALGKNAVVDLDATGRFVLLGAVSGSRHTSLAPRDQPENGRPIAESVFDGDRSFAFFPGSRQVALSAVHISPKIHTVFLGVPSRLHVLGATATDSSVAVPAAVVEWFLGASSGIRLDPHTGTVLASQLGIFTLHVTAGGWVQDSLVVNVVAPHDSTIFQELWADSTLKGWVFSGEPVPKRRTGPGGIPAFLNNGDGFFDSGAFSRFSADAEGGLGVDAEISAPISSFKWQRLKLGLLSSPRASQSSIVSGPACVMTIPLGEGSPSSDRWSISTYGEGKQFLLNPALRSGKWFRIRLQIFPDGTCGVALDGKPMWRSTIPIDVSAQYHVGSAGQSVGTAVLLGPFAVWRGVRGGVDWAALETFPEASLKPKSP